MYYLAYPNPIPSLPKESHRNLLLPFFNILHHSEQKKELCKERGLLGKFSKFLENLSA
jgi:hypothetical protein